MRGIIIIIIVIIYSNHRIVYFTIAFTLFYVVYLLRLMRFQFHLNWIYRPMYLFYLFVVTNCTLTILTRLLCVYDCMFKNTNKFISGTKPIYMQAYILYT